MAYKIVMRSGVIYRNAMVSCMKHSHGEWCESLGSHGVCCESADYMGINCDSQGEITYISYYESVIHHKAVLVSGDGNKIIMVSGMDHETVVLGAGSNKQ